LANRMNIRMCGEQRCKRNPCIICRLFGSTYTPGRLHFSDALLVQEWQRIVQSDNRQTAQNPFELSIVRMGTKLERATHIVEPDFLFSFEQTADGLRFKGSIVGQVDVRSHSGVSTDLPLEVWILVVALQLVDKVGGLRSRGLGRCKISVNEVKIDENTSLTYNQLIDLLRQDDYLLGLTEYEQRNNSNT